jgi:hypothetical protein
MPSTCSTHSSTSREASAFAKRSLMSSVAPSSDAAAGAVDGLSATGDAGTTIASPLVSASKATTLPDGCTTLRPACRMVIVPLPITDAVRASGSSTTAVCSSTPRTNEPSGSDRSIKARRCSPR